MAAKKIYEFLEGPLFWLGQFLKHFFMMIMYYFKKLVDYLANVGHSSLKEFLMAPLRNIDTDEIFLELIDEMSPGVLKTSGSFLYVIMPMRVSQ